MRRTAGFTLLELLVAVAIFGLASALAYGGLRGVVRAREQLQQQSTQLQRLQFAVGLIERDLRAAVERPVRDGYSALQPALQLRGDRIELSRIGRANALAMPRAEIERVVYQLDGNELQRLRFDVLDRAGSSVPDVQLLLDAVAGFELRALDAAARPVAEWPPRGPGQHPPLPRAVEVVIRFDGALGEVRRLLELPDGATAERSP